MSSHQASVSREREIYKVTIVGSVVNFVLLLFKFFAGIVGHSAAMIADAVHSLSDFVTDIIVLVFVRISSKPEDAGHDYGHGKYETLATAIIGLCLFVVGLGILWNGAEAIWHVIRGGALPRPGMLALWAALISIVLKEVLYQYTAFVGRKVQSQAVVANAWLDPIAAVIVSFFILKVSVKLLVPSMNELLEKSLPAEEEKKIINIVQSYPGITAPHHLRTRRIGNNCSIDLHIRMDGNLTLEEAHRRATVIEHRLRGEFGKGTYINIHVEPTK